MEFEFPFEVPADLSALSAEEFAAFAAQARTNARTALSASDTPAPALIAYQGLMDTVVAEEGRRTEEATQAAAARAALAATTADPAPAEPATDPAEPATDPAPATPPAPAPAPAPTGTLDTPPEPETQASAVLVASSDGPNVGQELGSFTEVAALLDRRLSLYPANGNRPNREERRSLNAAGTHFRMGERTLVRHGGAAIQRRFEDALTITGKGDAMSVLNYAMSGRRLPGGSLIASKTNQIEKLGKSLTAAAGWCAPSETIYDLCMLETRAGILDLPSVQAARGGFNIPENGGPDFASIYNAIGDAGDTHLSEYDVENGTDKVCIEVPCPDFVEVRLGVDYLCITGNFLQQRGYPEAVGRFQQGALVGLDHKVNKGVIAALVAGSTNVGTVPNNTGGDDAMSQLMSAVELAAEDIKYRNRMDPVDTIEIVLPYWAIPVLRAALARRRGVSEWNVSDGEILAAFTTRHVVPHFVYDWQDAFSAGGDTPGKFPSPITAFPTTISFLAYPAGTWVKAERSVINLDTVYDNAMLTNNQFTALFTEDGWAVLKMCVDSRLYSVGFTPDGLCCA